jgi:hypothetical protein
MDYILDYFFTYSSGHPACNKEFYTRGLISAPTETFSSIVLNYGFSIERILIDQNVSNIIQFLGFLGEIFAQNN